MGHPVAGSWRIPPPGVNLALTFTGPTERIEATESDLTAPSYFPHDTGKKMGKTSTTSPSQAQGLLMVRAGGKIAPRETHGRRTKKR